ncbi:protoheme IX farnesyltransferase, mitochondrial-like, partial [Oppia nitens]|uniref:protoheme IX farnesyltransferase, mitochondrial-like n=1 Tax=Oppia nitens TaxID=1686743 RepID=UPI0023DA1C27
MQSLLRLKILMSSTTRLSPNECQRCYRLLTTTITSRRHCSQTVQHKRLVLSETTGTNKMDNKLSVETNVIQELNNSDNLLLYCPKWQLMYDVFYKSAVHQTNNKTTKMSAKITDDITDQLDKVISDDTNGQFIGDWKSVDKLNSQSLAKYYSQLAKLRLTGLVVLTTMAGYYMGLQSPLDPMVLSLTLLGTGLTSSSATAINQFLEIPFDSQMKRTKNRPLVLGKISPLHACGFAAVTGVSGLALLLYVNPLTALLGASNLVLYSFIYTPMKRAHIANTWIGAIVGAIPPVMGFTAATNSIGINAILMGLILYSWQFPHFNALSWNMRHEYARAGFRMMSVTEPKLCLNTSLRHSCLILVYSTIMCSTLTTWMFAVDSLPINLYLIYLAHQFRSNPDAKSSRKLFFYSLIHLPALILLMCISKRRDQTNKTTKSNNNPKDD